MSACQAPVVKLRAVITSGTGVADWPRWNALIVFGHNLDPALAVEARSSSDNFAANDVLEATRTVL